MADGGNTENPSLDLYLHIFEEQRDFNSQFDTMLEILPDTSDNSNFHSWYDINKISELEEVENDDITLNSSTKPINIVNINNNSDLQNGEIAQIWDFNVDKFIMTPSDHSSVTDSATISQASSLNLENSNHIGHSNTSEVDNNPTWNTIFEPGVQFSQYISDNSNNNHLKKEDCNFTLFSKRSSLQSKDIHMGEDNMCGQLISQSRINLVRKNSIAKEPSSPSYAGYRRGSNLGFHHELSKKPQIQCFNCKTFKTPLWRRDVQGNTLCNACGLFQKLHGTMRPLSLKSDIIKKRHTKKRTKKLNGENNAAIIGSVPLVPRQPSSIQQSYSNSSQRHMNQQSINLKTRPKIQPKRVNDISVLSGSMTSLNSSILLKHDRKIASEQLYLSSKTSRRNSASSSTSNSSSKSSSRRGIVPILPKPSPAQLNIMSSNLPSNGTTNMITINSTTSSPRYSNSPRQINVSSLPGTSPLASTTVASSLSGISGVTIPRRKYSKPLLSQSSSFMAQSLQNLQQQNHNHNDNLPTVSFQTVESSISTISDSNSWNNTNNIKTDNRLSSIASEKSSRSVIDLFSPIQDCNHKISSPVSIRAHKSLLSQQLQDSVSAPVPIPTEDGNIKQNISFQTPIHNNNVTNWTASMTLGSTSLSTSFKKSSTTSSPRNSYADSSQQQRGMVNYDIQMRESTQISYINDTDQSQLTSSSKKEKENEQNQNSGNKNNTYSIMDDLDWLKFGL